MNTSSISISVLLSTRNRANYLERLLSDFESIDQPNLWEVLVVNNGSNDNTQFIIDSYQNKLPLISLHEPSPGKSRALNKAIANANGNILLFIDDDIIPDNKWLVSMQTAVAQNAEMKVFGGRIRVDDELLPPWLRDSYNLKTILATVHDLGNHKIIYGINQYPVGPNIAVRRFDPALIRWPEDIGPGTNVPVGDEYQFLTQISAPETPDRLYVPSSVVHHIPETHEFKLVNAIRRCFFGGYSAGMSSLTVSNDGKSNENLITLSKNRFLSTRSVYESILILSRAIGFLTGRLKYKLN